MNWLTPLFFLLNRSTFFAFFHKKNLSLLGSYARISFGDKHMSSRRGRRKTNVRNKKTYRVRQIPGQTDNRAMQRGMIVICGKKAAIL